MKYKSISAPCVEFSGPPPPLELVAGGVLENIPQKILGDDHDRLALGHVAIPASDNPLARLVIFVELEPIRRPTRPDSGLLLEGLNATGRHDLADGPIRLQQRRRDLPRQQVNGNQRL